MSNEVIKILIVEDDPYWIKVLTRYVENICDPVKYPGFDFQLQTYSTAQDCIVHMDLDTDIALVDYVLINEQEEEKKSGLDVIRELKSFNSNCKIIVISGHQQQVESANLEAEGIHDYIQKSSDSGDKLKVTVEHILDSPEFAPFSSQIS